MFSFASQLKAGRSPTLIVNISHGHVSRWSWRQMNVPVCFTYLIYIGLDHRNDIMYTRAYECDLAPVTWLWVQYWKLRMYLPGWCCVVLCVSDCVMVCCSHRQGSDSDGGRGGGGFCGETGTGGHSQTGKNTLIQVRYTTTGKIHWYRSEQATYSDISGQYRLTGGLLSNAEGVGWGGRS